MTVRITCASQQSPESFFEKNYTTLFFYKGRINRKTYWLCCVCIYGVPLAIGLLVRIYIPAKPFGLIATYSWICLTIKRFHDTDRSFKELWRNLGIVRSAAPWLLNALFFPLILCSVPFYIFTVCGFFSGTKDKNNYGKPPE